MPTTRSPQPAALVERLFVERPALHGPAERPPVNWQLGDRLVRWMLRELPANSVTLETGCGYSTVAFAALSQVHTVISPIRAEHERVRAWCSAHEIGTEHVRFIADGSQAWLPKAAADDAIEPLDLVLIDGDHAYPIPGIDWYYTAGALKLGGLMIVDDVSIRACHDLRRFLEGERGRWEVVTNVDDASVFRKISADVVSYTPWNQQPWNRRRPSLAEVVSRARSGARVRSRLRAGFRRRPLRSPCG